MSAPRRLQPLAHLVDDREFARLGAGKPQLGRVDHRAAAVAHLGQALAAAREDAQEPHRGIERVVIAVIASAIEDMAAHLAGERRADLGHLAP